MKLRFYERCGIDRFTITNFYPEKIDIPLLESRGGRVMCGSTYTELPGGEKFTKVTIRDNKKFADFTMEVKLIGGRRILCAFLDIPSGNRVFGNIQNITMSECRRLVANVFDYLESYYGVTCDYSEVSFAYLELNCTFVTEEPFRSYNRGLGTALGCWGQKSWGKLVTYSSTDSAGAKKTVETFSRSRTSGSLGIYIYDKSKQIEKSKKLRIRQHLMRIEIRLDGSQAIKQFLKKEPYLHSLCDDELKIFFWKQFKAHVIDKYYKWKKAQEKKLDKMVKEYQSRYYRWIGNFLADLADTEIRNQLPVLLDIEQLENCPTIQKSSKPKRVMTNLRKRAAAHETCFCQNCDKGLESIFEAVRRCCDGAGTETRISVKSVRKKTAGKASS